MSPHKFWPIVGREEVRQHLVAEHHWPAVARYEATAEDLEDLHMDMHDPRFAVETTARIRQILGMQNDEP